MNRSKLAARTVSSLVNIRLLAVVLVSTIVFSSLDFKAASQSQKAQPQTISRQDAELSMLKSMSVNVEQVATILRDNSVEIDASLLFTISGRKRVRPQLSAIPGMNQSKFHTGSLGGLVLANDLTLPERTLLDADTVIIANNLVFTGKYPYVSGPHAFHMFALDSVTLQNGSETVVTIDTSGFAGEDVPENRTRNAKKHEFDVLRDLQAFQNRDPNAITIDTSGARGADGFAAGTPGSATGIGYSGSSGESGVTGAVGKPGSCTATKGGAGEPGTDGLPGGKGGDGANGIDGRDARAQTIMIGSIADGYFRIIAKGGKGGDAGPGGPGGAGGKGGNGGPGGNGASCKCGEGLGEGGVGGTAGVGGVGGDGGRGGNGGAGGKGASLAIIIPGPFYGRVKQSGGAGSAGRGGRGGLAGRSGAAGTPGTGGEGGSLSGCGRSREGGHGSPAKPGNPGKHGPHGDWGKNGDPGSLSWTVSDEKSH